MKPNRFPAATLALVLILSIGRDISAGEAIPDCSVEALRSRSTTQQLSDSAEAMIDEWKKRIKEAKKADDEDLKDDLEDSLEVLEYTASWLDRASRPKATEQEVFEANAYANRILQTVRDPVAGKFLPKPAAMLRNIVLGSLFGIPAPRKPRSPDSGPMGEKQAARESAFLFNPEKKSFFTPEELASMTVGEVAELDVSPDNPLWYDRKSFGRLGPDPVAHFENFLERGMTGALREDDDLEPGETYDLHAARKVLFIKNIYRSATSPKGDAEDAYGVDWKLKWGDEVAVEPISSRLYLYSGAKMTDYVVTNGHGPRDMILVLMDDEDAKDDAEEADPEEEKFPTTVDELVEAVFDFYDFELEPYIHSQGVLTEENIDSLLRNLPANGKKKFRKEKLIGRHWVSFRESSVELQTKGFVRRHNGSQVSDHVAVLDRASRGSLIFNMWITNRDAKSGNNKAFFIKRSQDGKMEIDEYREGHHDMGLSLGSMWSAGAANKLKTGREFLGPGLFGRLRFHQSTIFRPEAWDTATWADCQWMSAHLGRIPESQIRSAVEASGWPDFVCDAMNFKMINRRDQIARSFGVDTDTLGKKPAAPSMTISLGKPAQIATAEQRYQLEPGSLAEELEKAGAGDGYREAVLSRGQIADCRDSALIRLLVRQRFPSGLSSRYRRFGDAEADCLRP